MSVLSPELPRPSENSVSSLFDKPTFAWLRERDIDILLASELHYDGEVRQIFAEKLWFETLQFVGAWVSVHEIDGENDLIAEWAGYGQRYIALIENKIGAIFQPDQAERYRLRKEKWKSQIKGGNVKTLLLCPDGYAEAPDACKFDLVVTYEEVHSTCHNARDGRSQFFSQMLAAGVKAYQQGYIPVPSKEVSAFWQHFWQSTARYPELRMAEPSAKPARSTWIYFRSADGLHGMTGVILVLKGAIGCIDLQFAATTVDQLHDRARHILADGMSIAKAGKSAAIRLNVPVLSFDATPDKQDRAIETSLEACNALRQFFVLHKVQLGA